MSRSFAPARLAALLALPIALAAAACGDDPVTTVLPPEARIDTTTFAPSLGIALSQFTVSSTGLYFKDRVVGSGDSTAATGKSVQVHYIGYLPNGRIFDQSSPDAAPLTFTVGAGTVVAGFSEAVIGMRTGGSRLVIIPPSLGYGYTGSGPIGSNQVLVFRIDLHKVTTPVTTPTT